MVYVWRNVTMISPVITGMVETVLQALMYVSMVCVEILANQVNILVIITTTYKHLNFQFYQVCKMFKFTLCNEIIMSTFERGRKISKNVRRRNMSCKITSTLNKH